MFSLVNRFVSSNDSCHEAFDLTLFETYLSKFLTNYYSFLMFNMKPSHQNVLSAAPVQPVLK